MAERLLYTQVVAGSIPAAPTTTGEAVREHRFPRFWLVGLARGGGLAVVLAVQGALIGRNLIGTNLQSSDFTRADLAVGLRGETYLENGLDLGAESLPIPEPLEALESLDPIAP